MIEGYKHIIWDWNGTLLNDVEFCKNIMNSMLLKRNLEQISIEKYKEIFTFPVIDYYKRTGLDLTVDSFENLSIEFISAYEAGKKNCDLYNGVIAVLEKIDQLGIKQSVLSAYSQDALTELINYFNLKDFFIKLVGLDNIYAAGKIENGKKWMNELQLQPHQVLLIGDSVHDFEVATEIGADSILVSHGHQMKKTLLSTGTKVIDNLSELIS